MARERPRNGLSPRSPLAEMVGDGCALLHKLLPVFFDLQHFSVPEEQPFVHKNQLST